MITILGDFISFFAILLILEKSGISPEYNGLNIIFQACAYSISAMTYPYLSSRIGVRNLLILSQICSMVAASTILFLYLSKSVSLVPFIVCTFTLTFCYQAFDNAKNHYSKLVGVSNDHHQRNEVQLLKYFFGAQTFGPIISVLLIYLFPLWVPLVVDILTFIICTFLAAKLKSVPSNEGGSSFLSPFKYIWKFPELRDVTLLRSIGFWIGAGVFDYLMVPTIKYNYGTSVTYLAGIYSALGFGGAVGVSLIRNPITEEKWIFGKFPMWTNAVVGNLGMMLTMIYFWTQDSIWKCFLVSIVHGIFMGVLAASSQSMRKIAATNEQFPEILSMEVMIGRLTAFIGPFIIFGFITVLNISYESFRYIPAFSSFTLAVIYFVRFGMLNKTEHCNLS
jgi:hypothetical protein